jgi:nickel transport protein
MTRALLFALALLSGAPALSHELQHAIAPATAVEVRLAYADGKPFAYETYELYPQGSEVPAQVGKTDAQGRVLFVPGEGVRWRLRAFSADGHGADFAFDAPALAAAPAPAPASDRSARILFGLSALLAAFAAFQFFARRKRTP